MSGLLSFFSGMFDKKMPMQLSDDSGVLMSHAGCAAVSDTKPLSESAVGNLESSFGQQSPTNSDGEFIQNLTKADSDHHQELVINCLSVKSNTEENKSTQSTDSSEVEKLEVGESKSTQSTDSSDVEKLEVGESKSTQSTDSSDVEKIDAEENKSTQSTDSSEVEKIEVGESKSTQSTDSSDVEKIDAEENKSTQSTDSSEVEKLDAGENKSTQTDSSSEVEKLQATISFMWEFFAAETNDLKTANNVLRQTMESQKNEIKELKAQIDNGQRMRRSSIDSIQLKRDLEELKDSNNVIETTTHDDVLTENAPVSQKFGSHEPTKQISPKSVDKIESEMNPESIYKKENQGKNINNNATKSNGRAYWVGLNQHFDSIEQIIVPVTSGTIDGYNELTKNSESLGEIQSLYSTPSASCVDLSTKENKSTASTSYIDSLKQLLASFSASAFSMITAPKMTVKAESLKSASSDISALKVTQSEPASRVILHHSESTILNDTPSMTSMPETCQVTADDDVISPTESRQNHRRLMPPSRRFVRDIVYDQSSGQNNRFQKLTEWVGQGYDKQNTRRLLFE